MARIDGLGVIDRWGDCEDGSDGRTVSRTGRESLPDRSIRGDHGPEPSRLG
ncbi:hypothetical protein ACFQL1_08590 [Halomicroarcula sp. GCM10025709]|uniref:hypothetical protein n=1 Tax=Haloarcula TaxID=2237 RepID=UPI0024C2E1A3|nr:hypothetical protein [Halomicroarcula sp. YJ-61-S]